MLPVVFPVVGPTRVRDTYYAARGGGSRVHRGIDLPAAEGTPIRAATPGRIRRVWHEGPRGQPNQGNAIAIEDPEGWIHLYAHLRDAPPLAWQGREVTQGEPLGVVGNTGNARNTGPHLHYHISRGFGANAQRVNPTARLALLFAAMETRRAELANARRPASSLSASTPRARPSSSMRPSVRGVGDDRDLDYALDELASEDRIRTQTGTPQRTALATTRGPTTRTPSPAPALANVTYTADQWEQARVGYRAVVGMVQREVQGLEQPSFWSTLLNVADPRAHDTAQTLRAVLLPTAAAHVRMALAAADRAERGDNLQWLSAYNNLVAAHRIVVNIGTPLESLIDAVDRSGVPLASVLSTELGLIRTVTEAFDDVGRSFELLAAIGNEGFDDMREAAPAVGFGFGAVLALVGIGAAWYFLRQR